MTRGQCLAAISGSLLLVAAAVPNLTKVWGGGDERRDLGKILVRGRGYGDLSSLIGSNHIEFSEKVLMVRHHTVLEKLSFDPYPSKLGDPGSPAAFAQLMTKLGVRNFDATAVDWNLPYGHGFLSTWVPCRSSGGARCLESAPFRLLAIAFRPDLANFLCGQSSEGPNSCGAEIHFEFGWVNSRGQPQAGLGAIVEFVVGSQTKAQYREMVLAWKSLETITTPVSLAIAFQHIWLHYQGVFNQGRLRMTTGSNTWILNEFRADKHGRLLIFPYLEGELNRSKWLLTATGCEITSQARAALASYGSDVRNYPPSLFSTFSSTRFPPLDFGLRNERDLRFAIARDACSGCHAEETGTRNVHIRGRARGSDSALSPFLTGKSWPGVEYGGPSIETFPHEEPTDRCGPKSMRRFNDLGRRHAYIDAVLALNPATNNWTALLRNAGLSILTVH